MKYSIRAGFVVPIALFIVAVAVVLFFAPELAHAQIPGANLSDTIRAEIMNDPRTAAFSQGQIDEMVGILTQAAEAEGITAADITWRPQDPASFSAQMRQAFSVCEGTPTLLCSFDVAFGFLGPDSNIPFILGAASMGLVWILAEMIHRRRFPAVSIQTPSQSTPQMPPQV